MTDRNQNQNQPKPGQQKNPNQTRDDQRDDQQWDQTPARVRPDAIARRRSPLLSPTIEATSAIATVAISTAIADESQQDSGMNDPVSGTNRESSGVRES